MNITLSFKNSSSLSPFASFKRPLCTTLHLLGEFQAYNAAAAAIAVKTAYPDISEETIERGLSKAFLPGRFEILHTVANYPHLPALILDGAHTVNSIQFTMDTFHALFEKTDTKAHLLFACAADKDVKDIAPLLKNSFSRITLTRPGSVKQSNMSKLTEAFSDAGMDFEADDDFARAIKKALSLAEAAGEPLLVTGSFYLVAEVKKIIAGM